MSREFSFRTVSESRHDIPWSDDQGQAGRFPADRVSRACKPTPEHPPEGASRQLPFIKGRTVLYDRDHGYRLSGPEVRLIAELGKFRVIAEYDLTQHLYAGSLRDGVRDIESLVQLGLAERRTFAGPEATPRDLLTLTRPGHRLLRANEIVPRDQPVYHGFLKPKEANHDADLYRLYQKQAARIRSEGGKNLRVILDYELKRRINRDLARYGSAAKPEIADRHGLRVVHGKIPLPDLRIEYETRDGEMAQVNLELITEHYRPPGIAQKARAGFSLFTPEGRRIGSGGCSIDRN